MILKNSISPQSAFVSHNVSFGNIFDWLACLHLWFNVLSIDYVHVTNCFYDYDYNCSLQSAECRVHKDWITGSQSAKRIQNMFQITPNSQPVLYCSNSCLSTKFSFKKSIYNFWVRLINRHRTGHAGRSERYLFPPSCSKPQKWR